MRRPEKDQSQHSLSPTEAAERRDREISERLKGLIAQKRKDDLEGNGPRTRGRVNRILRPRMDSLREMMTLGMNIGEMGEMLAEAGIAVNYHSLRGFLIKNMHSEYREHLAIGLEKGISEAATLRAIGHEDTQAPADVGGQADAATLAERVEQYPRTVSATRWRSRCRASSAATCTPSYGTRSTRRASASRRPIPT